VDGKAIEINMYQYLKKSFFSKDETVNLWTISDPNYIDGNHIHEFLELVYTISGTVIHKIDEKEYTTTPGCLIFINPRQIHSVKALGNAKFVNILIKQDLISEYAIDGDTFYNIFRFFLSDSDEKLNTDTQLVKFKDNDAYEIKHLINFMITEKNELNPGYAISLNGYARILLTKLFRALQQNNPDENYPKDIFLNMMGYLIDYIDKNYSEPITLSSLAAKCYFNPSYISREFKKFSGKGFKEYLTEKRITEAAKFLVETDMSIEEILQKICFSDKTRFFKEFSNYYNCTPGEYRKNKR